MAVAGLAKVTAHLRVAAIDSPGKVLGIVAVPFRASIVEEAAPETLATVVHLAGEASEVVAEREAVVEEVPGVVVAAVVEEGVVVEVGGGDKQKDEGRVASDK